jgi:hypothetical protein
MNNILFQMNSITAPSERNAEPLRQIKSYFNLLKNMGHLGFQLIIEKKYGPKFFDGIMNDENAIALYDDIVVGVMRPDLSDSNYFHPEEIDAIAETLAGDKMTLARCAAYLKQVIHSRIERLALEVDCDGDTHVPAINWLSASQSTDSPTA